MSNRLCMIAQTKRPTAVGQLVWCPGDPTLGIGVVTDKQHARLRVRFWRLQQEREYTTRGLENVILRYEIANGERVHNKQNQTLRVKRLLENAVDTLAIYELEDGSQVVESELLPQVRDIGAKERLATLHLTHPEVVRARLLGLQLTQFADHPGYAAIFGARVQWLQHQLDVASQAMGKDPLRLLLADEVGLGKTVEAALIYMGLRQEGKASRVLILAPDALCIQWLGEFYRKTHELLVLMDAERIDDAIRDFPDMNPFEAHQRIVASIDAIARDPVLTEHVTTAHWDLLIVDEAHHLRWQELQGGNLAYRLVHDLAEVSRHMLLLTATPMALDPAEYHALLRLLDPVRFDDPQMFTQVASRASAIRDLARDITQAVEQKIPLSKNLVQQIGQFLGDDAQDLQALAAWLAADIGSPQSNELLPPVLEALRHNHGLTDYVVRNRRGPVGGLPNRVAHVFALAPTPMQEILLEIGESVMFELVDTIDDEQERWRTLGELLRALWATPRALADILRPYSSLLAEELEPVIHAVTQAPLDEEGLPTGDARLRWLVQYMNKLPKKEKLLVFVESAVAVRALKDALEPLTNRGIAMFHRGLSPRDQDRQVAYFRDPKGPSVMLSTESGGEGRNFQFCHRVVLYDMPWRPATVEQRIGRVDRVGQQHDVQVLVPYLETGYEAAVLKIMRQSIGVLDRTVGGIDHELEYVSQKIAQLILSHADADTWKQLFKDTQEQVDKARSRIEADVDPILDFASFSPARAQALLQTVPTDLENKLESFVQKFATHNKIDMSNLGNHCISIVGGKGAAGRDEDADIAYTATFKRIYALDHEDVEFLSFGHPLVEQAFEWAREAHEVSAALAVCRGFNQDGAIFLWCFGLDLPEDAPQASSYFAMPMLVLAVDEKGQQCPEFEHLLQDETKAFERMDVASLRDHLPQWRNLVESAYVAADKLAQKAVATATQAALQRLQQAADARQRDWQRAQKRSLQVQEATNLDAGDIAIYQEQQDLWHKAQEADFQHTAQAINAARPRLLAAVAVRLVRSKQVSA